MDITHLKKLLSKLSLLCLGSVMLNTYPSRAQNANFQDLLLQKIFYKKNGTTVQDNLELNFLWGRPYWATLSNDIVLKTPLHIFTPQAGLYSAYVYQEKKSDIMEVRPWMGGKVVLPYGDKLRLYARSKVELRNFFYTEDIPRNNYARWRVMGGMEYFFIKNDTKNTAWSIDANYEWFFFQAPAQDEQYSNFRKFTLKFKHYFANNNTLLLKVESNVFLSDTTRKQDEGFSFTLEYEFW